MTLIDEAVGQCIYAQANAYRAIICVISVCWTLCVCQLMSAIGNL